MPNSKRGRPKVDQKIRFKNVALIDGCHDKLREIADYNERTMTRELKVMINGCYTLFQEMKQRECENDNKFH